MSLDSDRFPEGIDAALKVRVGEYERQCRRLSPPMRELALRLRELTSRMTKSDFTTLPQLAVELRGSNATMAMLRPEFSNAHVQLSDVFAAIEAAGQHVTAQVTATHHELLASFAQVIANTAWGARGQLRSFEASAFPPPEIPENPNQQLQAELERTVVVYTPFATDLEYTNDYLARIRGETCDPEIPDWARPE